MSAKCLKADLRRSFRHFRVLAISGPKDTRVARKTALTMVFKLCQSASKKWRRLDGSHQIAAIIQGVKFKDGEKLTERAA